MEPAARRSPATSFPRRIATASAKMASLLPDLTRPGNYTSNYDAYGGTQYNRENWDVKVNYNPVSKAMVWGRYSISPLDILAPLQLGPPEAMLLTRQCRPRRGRVTVAAIGFTYTLSPSLILDGNVGYTRQNIGANGDPQDGNFGLDVLHIPGPMATATTIRAFPRFSSPGLPISKSRTGSPFQFRDNQYLYAIN